MYLRELLRYLVRLGDKGMEELDKDMEIMPKMMQNQEARVEAAEAVEQEPLAY